MDTARVAVVTDSAACIPAGLVQKYGIRVLPFELVWEGRSYRDGQDLSATEFYRRLRASTSSPTTSQPPLGEFAELYSRLGREFEGIVSIHLPGELSGIAHTARLAAEQASPVQVRVIDTRTAAIAEGFVVLAAARAAAAGGSLEQVAAAAEETVPCVGFFAALETLEYLRRGGRIGEAASLLGSKLRLQPIVYLAEARVKVAGVARSRQSVMERLVELAAGRAGRRPAALATFHADARQEAEQLADRLCARLDCQECWVTEFTPVMGAHSGPGTLGVAFCAGGGAETE